MRRLLALLLVLVLLIPLTPLDLWAHAFLNSNEAGCDGSDPNVLLCEDFESGVWAINGCDQDGHPTAGNPTPTPAVKGWCGNIFTTLPWVPANGVSQNGVGGSKSGDSGVLGGGGGGNAADHALGAFVGVTEIYVRYYYKPSASYVWGNEKALTFNDGLPGDGGIRWGNFAFNPCGSGSTSTAASLTMGIANDGQACRSPNVGPAFNLQRGQYHILEIHIKLNTIGQSDGVLEIWADTCGASGTSCPTTLTKRFNHTNVNFTRANTSQFIRVLWWENWSPSNVASVGTAFYDNIKVSRVGPIGPTNATPAPGQPTNLRVCRGTNCTPS